MSALPKRWMAVTAPPRPWIKGVPVVVAPAKVVSFGEDSIGRVYVVTYGSDGVIYRIQ